MKQQYREEFKEEIEREYKEQLDEVLDKRLKKASLNTAQAKIAQQQREEGEDALELARRIEEYERQYKEKLLEEKEKKKKQWRELRIQHEFRNIKPAIEEVKKDRYAKRRNGAVGEEDRRAITKRRAIL